MKKLLVFFVFVLLVNAAPKDLFSQSGYWNSYKYKDVIDEIKKAGYSEREITHLFSSNRLEFYPGIHEIFEKAREMERDTTSNVYLNFLKPASIRSGRKFLRKHKDVLKKVEEKSGIEKEVIVALFRVESSFGRYQGTYQTFGILNSIVYYGNPNENRTNWGKKHLANFLKFHKRMKGHVDEDIFKIYSSYAGALGIPQFLPENYEKYAVDGDNDGKIDLFGSFKDAAWSSANLLRVNGWHKNRRKALYRWNRSTKFVNCILEYSRKLK